METRHRSIVADARQLDGDGYGPIELVVTSPPYPMIEMWDETFAHCDAAVADALDAGDAVAAWRSMHDVLDAVWTRCIDALSPGGLMCINIGDATRTIDGTFRSYPNSAAVQARLVEHGMDVLPGIVWRKATNAPNKFLGSGMLPAGAYVTLEHEDILIARKPGPKRSSAAERPTRAKSALFWAERNAWYSDLWQLGGERQRPNDASGERRTAAFPLEIAFRLVHMHSLVGDTVLDPFAGTGTTALACLAAARNSISIDMDATLAASIPGRLERELDVAAARERQRLLDQVDFVDQRRAQARPLKHVNEPHGLAVVTGQERALEVVLPVAVEREARDVLVARHRACDEELALMAPTR